MLEPPDLPEERLRACLRDAFGLHAPAVAFLPLGADPNTAVYRADADGGTPYFVKLRRGAFDEVSVAMPRWLSEQGVEQVIPSIPARDGGLWARLEPFAVIVYPFIEGDDGYNRPLSPAHWRAFGKALRTLHTARLPDQILDRIPAEQYDDGARRELEAFLAGLDHRPPDDHVAAQLVAFLKERHAETLGIVRRADELARSLRARAPELVVCHADAHAANIIIADERLYIVDWDTLIRAPKERDLMFIGGGQGFAEVSPEQEQELFYAGYGPAAIDGEAVAYYRYERIIQDIAIYCGDILLHKAAGADREQALVYLMSNYRPGSTIAMARAAEI